MGSLSITEDMIHLPKKSSTSSPAASRIASTGKPTRQPVLSCSSPTNSSRSEGSCTEPV
jgi:hypothetical protein